MYGMFANVTRRIGRRKRPGTARHALTRSVATGLLGLAIAIPAASQQTVHAIADVNVVDVRTGAIVADQVVVITGRRISAVGASGDIDIPAGARVIEGRGRYLIPGLWDMHVHAATTAERDLPAFLALGVTGVRNMHTTVDTSLELTQAIKRRLASGAITGPRFLANGGIVDGPVPIYPGSVPVATAGAARRAVDSLVTGGADFIKVYARLPRDAYFAIVDQARSKGVPFVGHVPVSIRVTEAIEAGQRSIEHTDALSAPCSADRDSIHALMQSDPDAPPPFRGYLDVQRAYLRNWTLDRCRDVIDALARAPDVWFVPTMAVYDAAVQTDSALRDEDARALLAPEQVRQWREQAAALAGEFRAVDIALLDAARATVRELHRAGVPMLAGTDYGNPFLAPGYSLHSELELLVDAGLTPLEALRSATLEPARFLAATDSLGTVERGKLADLVLLDANPLDDVRNTRRIRAVVADGRMFDRAALDEMLTAAKMRNRY